MNRLYSLLFRLVARPYAWAVVLGLGLLLHIGTTVTGGLYADDYIHAAYFRGSEALAARGLLDGIGVGEFGSLLANQFNFLDPATANYKAMTDFGMLPWWASQDALLHFFRPLSALTHYIDYQLFPDNTNLMHAVSLAWYGLGLLAIYLLYRGVGLEKRVAVLALLLVVLDPSIFQVVSWIAARNMLLVLAFGFFTLYAYHRSITSPAWYMAALLGLLLSLLSAEGALAICAWLGAYLFTLDQRSWGRQILHLLPFALLAILWRLYYQSHGYGAYGVDFYLDPGREPLHFLQVAAYRLPGNFFELASGVDFFSGQIRPDIRRYGFALGGVATLLLLLWLLWPQLRHDRKLAFFLLGTLFALVPGLAIALAPRVMMLPFVGLAVVLAVILHTTMENRYSGARASVAKVVAGAIVVLHIVIAGGMGSFIAYSTIKPSAEEVRGAVDLGVPDMAGKRIVVVNAHRPFWLAFAPYQMAANGEALPASIRVLAPDFYPVTLRRTAERDLLLEAAPALQYDPDLLQKAATLPAIHPLYLTQTLMGLIRASRDEWQLGERFELPEMTIRIEGLYQGKPSRLAITLKNDNLADFRWVYWDFEQKRYNGFSLPEVGGSIRFGGLMERPAPPSVSGKHTSIIFVIGDGMGPNYISAWRQFRDNPATAQVEPTPLDDLAMAMVTTRSESSAITDSAAAATALATGVKTRNGYVGIDKDGRDLTTVLEQAKLLGYNTGVVVTSPVTHATPASFIANINDRDKSAAIARQYLVKNAQGQLKFDLMLGGGAEDFHQPGLDLAATLQQEGFSVVEEWNQLGTLQKLPVLGLFSKQQMAYIINSPPEERRHLHDMTQKALALLEEKPFFLLVEASLIDWCGHDNDIACALGEMDDLMDTVTLLRQYVDANPNTLLLVTADHETGGLQLTSTGSGPPAVHWTTKEHTGVDVQLFRYGSQSGQFAATLDNTQIAGKIFGMLESGSK